MYFSKSERLARKVLRNHVSVGSSRNRTALSDNHKLRPRSATKLLMWLISTLATADSTFKGIFGGKLASAMQIPVVWALSIWGNASLTLLIEDCNCSAI